MGRKEGGTEARTNSEERSKANKDSQNDQTFAFKNSNDEVKNEEETIELVTHEDSSRNKDGRREQQLVKYTKFPFKDEQIIRSMKGMLFKLEFNKKTFFDFFEEIINDILEDNKEVMFRKKA